MLLSSSAKRYHIRMWSRLICYSLCNMKAIRGLFDYDIFSFLSFNLIPAFSSTMRRRPSDDD
jgi:hypothetical protein